MLEEGDDGEIRPVSAGHLDHIAIQLHNILANGMGGIDWAGLPLWLEVLGVADAEDMLFRLATVVTHRAPEENRARITDE